MKAKFALAALSLCLTLFCAELLVRYFYAESDGFGQTRAARIFPNLPNVETTRSLTSWVARLFAEEELVVSSMDGHPSVALHAGGAELILEQMPSETPGPGS